MLNLSQCLFCSLSRFDNRQRIFCCREVHLYIYDNWSGDRLLIKTVFAAVIGLYSISLNLAFRNILGDCSFQQQAIFWIKMYSKGFLTVKSIWICSLREDKLSKLFIQCIQLIFKPSSYRLLLVGVDNEFDWQKSDTHDWLWVINHSYF